MPPGSRVNAPPPNVYSRDAPVRRWLWAKLPHGGTDSIFHQLHRQPGFPWGCTGNHSDNLRGRGPFPAYGRALPAPGCVLFAHAGPTTAGAVEPRARLRRSPNTAPLSSSLDEGPCGGRTGRWTALRRGWRYTCHPAPGEGAGSGLLDLDGDDGASWRCRERRPSTAGARRGRGIS